MKKLLVWVAIWAAVFLLCINAAFAATQVGSGWYFSGETIKVENRAYTLLMTTTSVTADYTTGFLNLKNNTCDMAAHVRFCVDNIEYSYVTDLIRASMRIYTLKPTITLTRTITKSEFLVNEEVTITVTITNSGDAQATNMVYIDEFPSALKITEHEIMKKEGNSVKWTGTLDPSETETLVYKIKAKDEVETSVKGKLSYYDGFETKITYSDALALKVTPFLTLIPVLGRSTIYSGEIINYTVNISNIYYWNVSRLRIDILELVLDEGLEVIDKPSTLVNVSHNIYHWSGYLKSNSSQSVRIKIRGSIVPGGSIYAKAYYTDPDGTARQTKQYKTTLKVEKKGVKVSSNIEDITLEAYEKKRLKVWLQNLNPGTALKNVVVNISSNFVYLPYMHYSLLEAHSTETMIDKTIYGPAVTSTTNYKLEANVSYETEFKDNGTDTYLTTFTVEPLKNLEITQTISPAEIESGKTAIVTITVKNDRRVKVYNVYVRESFSDELKTTGITSKKMSINKKTTVTPYTYIITGPTVKTTTIYTINTTASYNDELINETYHKTIPRIYSAAASLTVKPRQFALTVTKTISDTELLKGEIIDVDYIIENPSAEQTAKNIVIHFPLSQDFDFVGEKTTFTIETLAPGEKFYVYGKEKIRSKYNDTSVSIPKTKVSYLNEDGAGFDANSTVLAKDFLYSYTEGPYIIAEMNCSDEVNNTEPFDVEVTLRNIGNKDVNVKATDGTNNWSTALNANSKKTFTYQKTVPTAMVIDLPQVIAYYSYKNNSFITGSNIEQVTVKNKPLIEVEKIAPTQANNIDRFVVTLKIRNLAETPLKQVVVADDSKTWLIESLEKEANFSYEKRISETGSTTLPKANINYTYNNYEYSAASSSLQIEIITKEIITAIKEVSQESVNQSQPVTISLIISNIEETPLKNVQVTDGEQKWTIDLTPKEQKTLRYEAKFEEVEEKTLPAATIRYEYNGEMYEIKSNTKTIRIHEVEEKPVKKAEEKPEGMLSKIVWYIKKILTWKRKG